MLKKRITAVVVGLALLAALVGSTGWSGYLEVPPAHACETSGSGGGC